jgi:hypothetical protein
VTVITNQIFALIIATLRPALTEGVYDTLKCILYCNIGDDATVNDAQWTAIRADITEQIGGIAGLFLEHLVYLLGTGGMTNLIRAGGAASGDCSSCECGAGCASSFRVGLWNGGVFYDYSAYEIGRTETTITIQGMDRGDGTRQFPLTTDSATDCCDISWTGDPPDYIWNKNFVPCGTNPTYEALVNDNLASSKVTNCLLFLGGLGDAVMTFTFAPPP